MQNVARVFGILVFTSVVLAQEPLSPAFVEAEITGSAFGDTLYRAMRAAAKKVRSGVVMDGAAAFVLETESSVGTPTERIRCQGGANEPTHCTFRVERNGTVRSGISAGKGMAKFLYALLLDGYVADARARTYEVRVTNPRLDNGSTNNFLYNNDRLEVCLSNLLDGRTKSEPRVTCTKNGIVNSVFSCVYEFSKPGRP